MDRCYEKMDGFGKNYHCYVVPCQFNGMVWEVEHRHKEFQALHAEVSDGINVPVEGGVCFACSRLCGVTGANCVMLDCCFRLTGPLDCRSYWRRRYGCTCRRSLL
jgi:hypothetical protein